MKTWRWLATAAAMMAAGLAQTAPLPASALPRPGAVLAQQIVGDVFEKADDRSKPVRADDRVRVGATLTTGRKSLATFLLSNGATVELGAETELELEEFGQATFPESLKIADLKEEPTVSRTRLRLVQGDLALAVKPLKISRGSSFELALLAGTVRTAEGEVRATVQMTTLGLGVATLELRKGRAEFQPAGSETFVPMPPGKKLAFALEQDTAAGTVKLSEMPKP